MDITLIVFILTYLILQLKFAVQDYNWIPVDSVEFSILDSVLALIVVAFVITGVNVAVQYIRYSSSTHIPIMRLLFGFIFEILKQPPEDIAIIFSVITAFITRDITHIITSLTWSRFVQGIFYYFLQCSVFGIGMKMSIPTYPLKWWQVVFNPIAGLVWSAWFFNKSVRKLRGYKNEIDVPDIKLFKVRPKVHVTALTKILLI
jgi:hypothetical protein